MHGGTLAEGAAGAGIIARGLARVWKSRAACRAPGASLVQRVLAARGLDDAAAAHEFLNPALTRLHEPALLPDMDKAADRVLRALRAREPVVIYGDYDVDGITATAILWHTFRALEPDAVVSTYVPHRIDEGYGLSVEAMNTLADAGARVVVSVDCGVTAIDAARAARQRGIDLVVTDHHNPPARDEDLPEAYAVIHPRRPGSQYPFGELSGAGVAYKFAWRLATLACGGARVHPALRTHLVEMLAFASLGTIADVVPLVGENRVLARHGLSRIKHSPIVGLRALVEAAGLSGEDVNAEDVGFKLAPRLNACGRLGHAREAVELLTTAGHARAAEIARQLCALNDERRRTEKKIFNEACAMAEARGMHLPDRRAIVLAHDGWHAGVVGIVCSRLVDRYARPSILLARSEDGWHGSGRSVEGFALADALARCTTLLRSHGGHDMAAGLRIDAGRLDEFIEAFVRDANDRLTPEDLVRPLSVDTDAAVEEITSHAVADLERLAPFGQGNPRVRVRITGVKLAQRPMSIGSSGAHAALELESPTRKRLRLVAWNWMDRLSELAAGQSVEVVVRVKSSRWTPTGVEGELDDLRI